MRPGFGQVAVALIAMLALSAVSLVAFPQDQFPTAPAQPYDAAQLDQLLAPIALYPDPLLGQVLMASTYPLEVVEAARWAADPANAGLSGDALASALEPLDWDPSVKALVPFPSVLQMMNNRLDWTQKLGDAFLAQQVDVMDAVQRLRRQAQDAGKLTSTPQQTVTTEGELIYIEPASPDVLYVPAYDPGVVYGPWPYPAYPPYFFPPPPAYYYSPLLAGIEFSVGFVIVQRFWGWDHCDWRYHRINIDARRVNVINRYHIDHFHRPPFEGRTWAHDPRHRIGVPYRSPQVRARFEPRLPGSPQKRYEYRGHEQAPPTVRVPRAQPPAWRVEPRVTERPAPRVTPPPTPRVIPPPAPRVTEPPAPRVTAPPAPRVTPPPAWRAVERPAAPIYQRSRSGAEAREFSNRGRESRQSTAAPRPPPSTPPPSAPPKGGGSGGGQPRWR